MHRGATLAQRLAGALRSAARGGGGGGGGSRPAATAAMAGADLHGGAPRRVVRGVVADMDGTLTVPCIDFAAMRRAVGIDTGDILTTIDGWADEARRAAAYAAIAAVEEQALANMQCMPGVREFAQLLDGAGVPRALLTRNVSSSVEFFHRNHFDLPPFFPALSREWTPYKPAPDAILHIAEQWGCPPSEVVMIGDSAKDDVVAGNRAGAVTILLDTESEWAGGGDARLVGELRPHFYCTSLAEAAAVLRERLELRPPARPDAAAAGEGA
jgi:HAD superfamily hydrolase (TIGR01549 family)